MKYHVSKNGAQLGVFELDAIVDMFVKGELDSSALVWTAGMESWAPVTTILPEGTVPPPVPPSPAAPAVPAVPPPPVAAPASGAAEYNLINATKGCLIERFAMFDGRARRSEYWWFQLGAFLVNIVLGMIPFVGVFLSLAMFVPCLAVAWRRAHDAGVPGWHMLIPFYNLYLAIAVDSQPANEYGSGPLPPVA